MACNMSKIANFSKAKQELIAMCIDHYTGDLANFVAENVKTDAQTIEAQIRERITNEVLGGAEFNFRTYRKYKNDIFEVIEVILDQTLPEGWKKNEFFNRFVEERRVDLGDTNEFYAEDNTFLTVSRFSGNHWDTIRERFDIGSSFSVKTTWFEVHFYNEFERFMKNIDSFAALLEKARKSFLNSFQNAIYTAFSNMGDVLPDGFSGKGTLSTDSEKEALLEIAEKVQTATGNKPVFVGSATALRKLQGKIEDNWIADSAKEERKKNGVVTTWEGYELVVLPNVFKAGTYEFELSTDKILIVSNATRPIKFVYEGESRMKQITDERENADMTYEAQIQTKAGIGVVADNVFGEWTLA